MLSLAVMSMIEVPLTVFVVPVVVLDLDSARSFVVVQRVRDREVEPLLTVGQVVDGPFPIAGQSSSRDSGTI